MADPKATGPPIHPGEVLQAELLAPHRLSRARLARATGLSYGRLARLARSRGRLSGEAALLLGRVFGTTPRFWLAHQAHHDLTRAQLTPAQVARAQAFGAPRPSWGGTRPSGRPVQGPQFGLRASRTGSAQRAY